MLTKVQLIRFLVDLIAVDDLTLLRADGNLPIEICEPDDRGKVRRMAALMADVGRDFEYERSPEFERDTAGKSPAVVSMKRRLAADPVKRVEHRRRFELALGDILSTDEVFMLVPKENHEALQAVMELARQVGNPPAEGGGGGIRG